MVQVKNKRHTLRLEMKTLDGLGLGECEINPEGLLRDKFNVIGTNPKAYRLTTRPGAKGGFIRVTDDSLLIRDPSVELRSLILESVSTQLRKSDKGLEFGLSQLEDKDITAIFEAVKRIAR